MTDFLKMTDEEFKTSVLDYSEQVTNSLDELFGGFDETSKVLQFFHPELITMMMAMEIRRHYFMSLSASECASFIHSKLNEALMVGSEGLTKH